MIGKNLKYYRQLAGLSQDKLAGMVGVTKMTISNYENDKRDADSEMLIRLADALSVNASQLLIDHYGSVSITHAEFRSNSGMSNSSRDMVYETVDRYLGRFNKIVSILGNTVLPNVSKIEKIQFTDIETAGRQLREFLSLSSSGPVGNIVDALENRGIIICQMEFSDSHFSGINGTLNERPYIAINKIMPPERQRFTLIHELSHILFVFRDDVNKEKTVDRITGAFFFPKDDVVRELGLSRTNIKGELRPLQREYGISMQCILIRARQAGCINESVYEKHQRWISGLGLRKDEKSGLPAEYSTLFKNLVIRAVSEDMININKASELLDLPNNEIKQLCGLEV